MTNQFPFDRLNFIDAKSGGFEASVEKFCAGWEVSNEEKALHHPVDLCSSACCGDSGRNTATEAADSLQSYISAVPRRAVHPAVRYQ